MDTESYPRMVVLRVMGNLAPVDRAWAIVAYELLRLRAHSARIHGKEPAASEELIKTCYSELFATPDGTIESMRGSSLLLAACIARADKMARTGMVSMSDAVEVWEQLAEAAGLLNEPVVRALWTADELGPLGTFETEQQVTQYLLSFMMPPIYRIYLKRFRITDPPVAEDLYVWVD